MTLEKQFEQEMIKIYTEGFATLWQHNRLDLSVEAHVLKPEYTELFSDEERQLCRDRLKEFGYPVD